MFRGVALLIIALAVSGTAPVLAEAPVYNLGTLTFHGGGVASVPSYDIGTLTFRGPGSASVPEYDIGTLVFRGPGATTITEYDIGTLRFAGKPKLKTKAAPKPNATQSNVPVATDQAPPVIDLSKIFGPPPIAANTAPAPAPTQNAPLSKYRLKLLSRVPPADTNSTLH